jgi:hypothetical protein
MDDIVLSKMRSVIQKSDKWTFVPYMVTAQFGEGVLGVFDGEQAGGPQTPYIRMPCCIFRAHFMA